VAELKPKLTQSSDYGWFNKARSRAWAKPQANLARIPYWALVAGSFLFVGLSPFASGTIGSLTAVLLYYAIPSIQSLQGLLIASGIVLAIGIPASNAIEKALDRHDPGIIVADEVLGQWIALMSLWYVGDVVFIIAAFLFFRLFDIVKLYPATIFEHKTGGVGVMLDDAVAGIYANFAAHLATFAYYKLFAS
jgi:phosphatidylglycerophosphatase A